MRDCTCFLLKKTILKIVNFDGKHTTISQLLVLSTHSTIHIYIYIYAGIYIYIYIFSTKFIIKITNYFIIPQIKKQIYMYIIEDVANVY